MEINQVLKKEAHTTFKANLKVKPSLSFESYWYKNHMTRPEFQLLKDKFLKSTKDIKGNLILDFGSPYRFDGSIEYTLGKYSDKIGIEYLICEDLTSDKFVEKLVKVLNFFQKRKDLNTEINKLNQEKIRQEKRFVKKMFE